MLSAEKIGILAGGAGTITIGPDAAVKLYPHQGRYLTATIKMKSGNLIPKGATIDFSKSGAGDSTGFKLLYGEPDKTSVRVAIDPLDNTQGVAKLCVCYDAAVGTNAIVVNAQAGTGWTASKPDDAVTVTYTVLTNDPTVICSGASKTVLPIPSATDGDNLTPSTDAYTTKYTCTVMDGASPISDYIIEWHEAATTSHGLFSFLMNAYTAETATNADKLPSSDAVFILDTNQGDFVRTATDSSGTANLFLVAKHKYGPIAQGVIARYDFGVTYEYPRPFLVVDTSDAAQDLEDSQPRIDDVMDQDTLDFGFLENPPYVSVILPNDSDAALHDDIYLIVNGAIAAGPYHPDPDGNDLHCRALASLCFSNYLEGGGQQKNEMLFVVGSVDKGHSYASATTGFYGTGNNIELPGGTLDAALLDPQEGYINSTTLLEGWVAITIQLDQSTTSGWQASIGDTISGTAVLTGYKPNSDVLRQPQTVASSPLPPISAHDLDQGSVLLKFPVTPFDGWDARKHPPQTEGRCCLLYTVRGSGGDQNSEVLSVTLNTADLSY